MAKIILSDEEKQQVIEALNKDIDLPESLMPKLFPNLAEKFDVVKLDRAKVATLEYAGKRREASILTEAMISNTGSPLQVERCFDGCLLTKQTQLDLFEKSQNVTDSDWQNLIVQGDNLQFLKTCYQNTDPLIKDKVKGKVNLIYIDPPFATKSDFKGSGDEKSYSDKVESAEFIECLRERLIFMREILADDGSIYVHVDWRMIHFVRFILDELFGKDNFINEIIWHYPDNFQGNIKGFAINHNNIVWYSKGKNYNFNKIFIKLKEPVKRDKRIWSSQLGKLISARDENGNLIYEVFTEKKADDVWDIGQSSTTKKASSEFIGYPTQKPETLLERIISASSNPGDLVMDVFGGSGTTAAVAEKLGRRWIVCDFGKHAIYTMQKRILSITESKALGKDVSKNKKYNKNPKPFCIVSCGAYDFTRIMNLRENKEAYINFVLGLFKLERDRKNLIGKYKLVNIYGEKDGNPVEVYPVWEDEYLKEIRIDEEYLKSITTQAGGKLKGTYYIIAPETCTIISDTILKNSNGDYVDFKFLKFPYKILEDVSRNFQIQEQPNSQDNVNNLINSTGFYFNNDIEIELMKIKDCIKITRLKTTILNGKGERYEGFDGLAMLLVDENYDGKIFNMDKTVFAKEINPDGEIKIAGLAQNIAVIAVDRHGNESKPFIIQG